MPALLLMLRGRKLPLMEVAMKKPAQPACKKMPGPEPEFLKPYGKWRELIKKSFQKKRPAMGWPK